jgi:antitoxin FitA
VVCRTQIVEVIDDLIIMPPRFQWKRLGVGRALKRICAIIDSKMAQLIVRDIPQQVVARLKQRAASRGHSAEAEHREILKQALLSSRAPSLKAMLGGIPDVGRGSDFGRPRRLGRRVGL